jgi:hypothetical protein
LNFLRMRVAISLGFPSSVFESMFENIVAIVF